MSKTKYHIQVETMASNNNEDDKPVQSEELGTKSFQAESYDEADDIRWDFQRSFMKQTRRATQAHMWFWDSEKWMNCSTTGLVPAENSDD